MAVGISWCLHAGSIAVMTAALGPRRNHHLVHGVVVDRQSSPERGDASLRNSDHLRIFCIDSTCTVVGN